MAQLDRTGGEQEPLRPTNPEPDLEHPPDHRPDGQEEKATGDVPTGMDLNSDNRAAFLNGSDRLRQADPVLLLDLEDRETLQTIRSRAYDISLTVGNPLWQAMWQTLAGAADTADAFLARSEESKKPFEHPTAEQIAPPKA